VFFLPSSTPRRDGQIERLDEQRRQLVLSHERYVEELTADFERKLDEERQSRLQLEVRRRSLAACLSLALCGAHGDVPSVLCVTVVYLSCTWHCRCLHCTCAAASRRSLITGFSPQHTRTLSTGRAHRP
jgi:hypothetical protein